MPCKLPFSFCSVRHGAINGYLNKRLCPLLPAVTKTMLTGSQRSIHQQFGFNSGRPPSSIFLATVSMSVHFKNHIWSTYPASYFHPLFEKWARAHPPSQRVRRNRKSSLQSQAGSKVGVWKVFPAKENRLSGFSPYLWCIFFIYLFIVFYLLDLNLRISWSRDQLSVNTKTVRFWKKLLAGTERAY